MPEKQVVAVDWARGRDWTLYINPMGHHRNDEPCNAPEGLCPCKFSLDIDLHSDA